MPRPQMTTAPASSGSTPAAFFEFLRPEGDLEGSPNAIGDYSGTDPTLFIWTPPSTARLTSVTIQICAISVAEGDFGPQDYGNISGGLVEGISVGVIVGGQVIFQVPAFFKIRTLSDWAAITNRNDVFLNKFGPPGFQTEHGMATLIWEIAPHAGAVRLEKGLTIGMILNDDFSSLASHCFYVQGFFEDSGGPGRREG